MKCDGRLCPSVRLSCGSSANFISEDTERILIEFGVGVSSKTCWAKVIFVCFGSVQYNSTTVQQYNSTTTGPYSARSSTELLTLSERRSVVQEIDIRYEMLIPLRCEILI
jgi:hypothetical protein